MRARQSRGREGGVAKGRMRETDRRSVVTGDDIQGKVGKYRLNFQRPGGRL